MTNLEHLTSKIRTELPRLMEMSKGQMFTIKNMPFNYEFLHFIYEGEDEEITEVATLHNGEIDTFDYDWYVRQEINIIGKEPMFNDVLEWLGNSTINENGFIKRKSSIGVYSDFIGIWNLSKPYLKDQSEELINYLNNLK